MSPANPLNSLGFRAPGTSGTQETPASGKMGRGSGVGTEENPFISTPEVAFKAGGHIYHPH